MLSMSWTSGTGSGPTGYDNLANWPSIGHNSEVPNRPITNTSTKVMSWTGPVGGGASTSNDTPQTMTLTPHSGDISTTTNNQVISGQYITGNVNVNNTGVIIRNCYISWVSGSLQINLDASTTGVLIEDCEIVGNGNGTSGQGGLEGIGFVIDDVTIRRCNFHGMENGLSSTMNGTTNIVDSIIWGLAGGDNDGIEANSSTTAFLIKHCTFDQANGLGFTNSGVNITNVTGGVTGVAIDTCRFLNFPNFGICDGDSTSSGESWSCVNSSFFNCGAFRRDGTTCSPNSGNYTAASAGAHSGTLANGTGII